MRNIGPADHREEIRRLLSEAPDEPTYCEFKRELGYRSKKERGELVKDVSSFANIDLEALGGHGYLIFGVAPSGEVVGIGDLPGDPPSELRMIVNGHLDRPVPFEYLTCEVDDGAGGTERVAAVVVTDSKRRPHVASKNISEQQDRKTSLWLREGEVWVRKTGGRELATAEDLDAMYEGRLRRLVEERTRPLQERIEALERDLREQRSTVPELGFGLVTPTGTVPSSKGRPYPVLNNLIDVHEVRREVEWAKRESIAAAREDRAQTSTLAFGPALGMGEPDAEAYDEYGRGLKKWLTELEDLYVVDFALVNDGRVPAEDVEVVLEVPAELRPKAGSLEYPWRPRNHLFRGLDTLRYDAPPFVVPNPAPPDSLGGPGIYGSGVSVTVEARWDVGKLHHGRPLLTHSDGDGVEGLLISASNYRELLSSSDDGVRLAYTVRAANLPDAHRGAVILV